MVLKDETLCAANSVTFELSSFIEASVNSFNFLVRKFVKSLCFGGGVLYALLSFQSKFNKVDQPWDFKLIIIRIKGSSRSARLNIIKRFKLDYNFLWTSCSQTVSVEKEVERFELFSKKWKYAEQLRKQNLFWHVSWCSFRLTQSACFKA